MNLEERMKEERKELARKGSMALVSLNNSMRSNGQEIIKMNTDQIITFYGWVESQKGR